MSKRIGIVGTVKEGKYFGMGLSYMEWLSSFGSIKILTPLDVKDPPELDLLVLPGGPDINPLNYGAIPSFRTGNPNLMQEFFDARILPYYLKNNTPIFGICRGAQYLWAYFGGEIIQHNPYHPQSKYNTDEAHFLSFTNEFRHLHKQIGEVTSRHHQCMDSSSNVPEELDVVAVANIGTRKEAYADPSVVEIFKHKERPIVGVQFHPEDHSWESLSPNIIEKLLNSDTEKKGIIL